MDQATCCKAADSCSTMICPSGSGYIDADKKSTLSCTLSQCTSDDIPTCCQERAKCNTYTCPVGYADAFDKYKTVCEGSVCGEADVETCCTALDNCTSVECENDYIDAVNKAESFCLGASCTEADMSRCCMKRESCSTLSCVGAYVDVEKKVSKFCGGVTCGSEDYTTCCDHKATCSSFTCPDGFLDRNNSRLTLCISRQCTEVDVPTCCVKAATECRLPSDFRIKDMQEFDHGSVAITDSFNHKVVECDFDSGVCQDVAGAGKAGSDLNSFRYPVAVSRARAEDSDWIITDHGNSRLQKCPANGPGPCTTVASDLQKPSGMLIWSTGDFLVAEAGRHVVKLCQKSGAGCTSLLGTTGQPGNGTAQFSSPHDVKFHSSGRLLIADTGNDRVQLCPLGGGGCTTVAGTGKTGASSTQLNKPHQAMELSNGDILISDHNNNRVQRCLSDGSLKCSTVAGDAGGRAGNGTSSLSEPDGIGVADNGDFIIADRKNNRVQRCAAAGSGICTTIVGTGSGGTSLQQPITIFLVPSVRTTTSTTTTTETTTTQTTTETTTTETTTTTTYTTTTTETTTTETFTTTTQTTTTKTKTTTSTQTETTTTETTTTYTETTTTETETSTVTTITTTTNYFSLEAAVPFDDTEYEGGDVSPFTLAAVVSRRTDMEEIALGGADGKITVGRTKGKAAMLAQKTDEEETASHGIDRKVLRKHAAMARDEESHAAAASEDDSKASAVSLLQRAAAMAWR